jgi:HEAT repeat protein
MRLGVTMRRKVVLANKPQVPKWLLNMTVAEMLKSLQEEENQQKHKLMAQELGRRGDHESLQGLGLFAVSFYPEVKEPSIRLLQEKMRKLKTVELQEFLKDANPLLRQKAAETMGNLKAIKGADDLVPLLLDSNAGVQKAVREALVKIASGKDFGPDDFSISEKVKKSQSDWKQWLTEQGMK